MKKISFIIVSVFLFSLTTGAVSAQTVTSIHTITVVPTQVVTSEERLAKLKNKVTKEINRRIAKLNNVLKIINRTKKLTEPQKSSLVSQVQAEITKLTALQTKINGITTLAALQIEIKTLDNEYRVFALFVPKIHIIVKADRSLTMIDKLDALAVKLEERIKKEKEKGKDVAASEALLADMKKHLADAKISAQGAIDTVMPLTPEGHVTNKKVLQNARKMLQAAHMSLKAANKDVQQIRKNLGLNRLKRNERMRRGITPRPTHIKKEHPTRSPRPTRTARPTHVL